MSDSSANNPFDSKFPGFAGFGPMMEQMESFKRLWSSMEGPSRLVPTLDVEELDKRITDLKAVEQWLNLNLNLLRGSIQALEIQRGTLAAVKAFGSAFQSPAGWPGAGFGAGLGAGSPFGQGVQAPAPSASASSAASASPNAANQSHSSPEASASTSARTAPKADPTDAARKTNPSASAPGIDPSAWWTLLQNNFQQIAEAALAGTTASVASKKTASANGTDRSAKRKSTAPAPRKAAAKPQSSGSAVRSATRKSSSGR